MRRLFGVTGWGGLGVAGRRGRVVFSRARRAGRVSGVVGGLVLVLALSVGAGAAYATTQTFTTVGCGNTVAANLFTVPAGVSSVSIVATGSAGETSGGGGGVGGSGDVVSGSLSGLTPGQTLDVCVNAGGAPLAVGTFPGGAGGGASGVAVGSDFTQPALIAAGGGGGGGAAVVFVSGGSAGNPSGSAGNPSAPGAGTGGGGGTQAAFGTGGAGSIDCGACIPGGNGAQFSSAGPGAGGGGGVGSGVYSGGGGGAGYFGGGGGGPGHASGGGGGGGSDFCASSLTTPVVLSGCAVGATPNTVFGTASVTLTYTAPAADLSISNSGAPNPVVSGQPLTYTITATNNGGQTATGVTVTDPLPASAHFDSVSTTQGSCTRSTSTTPKTKNGTVSCSVGSLAGGQSATITIVVTPTTAGTLTNTATVSGDQTDPTPADNSATATTTVLGTQDEHRTRPARPERGGFPGR
jgi:uncharacterized repeat protein (TIGR01451 family)